MKSIDNVSEKDTSANQTLELKAQKRAYEKLKEILDKNIPEFPRQIELKLPPMALGNKNISLPKLEKIK